jgi:hypothetical protein
MTDAGNLPHALLARVGAGHPEPEVRLIVTEQQKLRSRRRSELRDLLALCGLEPPNAIALNAVLSECPDVDLAFTALTMCPRPRWVEDLAGPLSR